MIVDQAGLVRFTDTTAEELLSRKEGALAMRNRRLVHASSSAHARFEALVQGLSPGEYAASAGVSLNTVRTQIRSLFDKTGIDPACDDKPLRHENA